MKSNIMAPSLAEPVNSLRAPPKSLLKTNGGHNKENLIGYGETYKHADEIKGTGKYLAASFPNYLPVWDNETERLVCPRIMCRNISK